MIMRKTTYSDIKAVMEIIHTAQYSLREMGINQWQNNYPNETVITDDINKGNAYVLLDEKIIIATAVISFETEPSYDKIYEGQWLTDNKYAVVHRFAVAGNYKRSGIASMFMDMIRKLCIGCNVCSIKIDTHRDNLPMQNMLLKKGYKYCGIIYLGNGFENCGDERLAFELVIDKTH